jgi:hypothetical protein
MKLITARPWDADFLAKEIMHTYRIFAPTGLEETLRKEIEGS